MLFVLRRSSGSAIVSFETGERGTEAVVDAEAEADVRVLLAADVEGLGILEDLGVAVRRPEEQHHELALQDSGVAALHVVKAVRRSAEPAITYLGHLLDAGAQHAWVVAESAPSGPDT